MHIFKNYEVGEKCRRRVVRTIFMNKSGLFMKKIKSLINYFYRYVNRCCIWWTVCVCGCNTQFT